MDEKFLCVHFSCLFLFVCFPFSTQNPSGNKYHKWNKNLLLSEIERPKYFTSQFENVMSTSKSYCFLYRAILTIAKNVQNLKNDSKVKLQKCPIQIDTFELLFWIVLVVKFTYLAEHIIWHLSFPYFSLFFYCRSNDAKQHHYLGCESWWLTDWLKILWEFQKKRPC